MSDAATNALAPTLFFSSAVFFYGWFSKPRKPALMWIGGIPAAAVLAYVFWGLFMLLLNLMTTW